MRRNKIKLAWIEKARSRGMSLEKRKAGLLKKVEELSKLCDVRACLIIFSSNEEVTVWPTVEKARELLENFFALPEMERKKNETSLDSYVKKKTKKLREKLTKTQTKNKNSAIDKLMVQIHSGCNIDDLNLSDIYQLIYFTKYKVTCYREKLNLVHYLSPRVPPVPIDFLGTSNGNKTYYLIDEWVLPNPSIINHQPFQLHYMNGIPTMVMNEPGRAGEQRTTVNHGDSLFRTLAITDGVRTESPPPNETSFDMNQTFNNNNHF